MKKTPAPTAAKLPSTATRVRKSSLFRKAARLGATVVAARVAADTGKKGVIGLIAGAGADAAAAGNATEGAAAAVAGVARHHGHHGVEGRGAVHWAAIAGRAEAVMTRAEGGADLEVYDVYDQRQQLAAALDGAAGPPQHRGDAARARGIS